MYLSRVSTIDHVHNQSEKFWFDVNQPIANKTQIIIQNFNNLKFFIFKLKTIWSSII